MRSSATTLTILLVAVLVLPVQAGVEIVMKSEIDIPGARMKIMGKDFSRSEQKFLVDDEATLKGTISGNSTSWIDLEREAFFTETKRGCTVTTFAEMEERLEAMQGEGASPGFMGRRDEAQRDPQDFDVRFESRVGPPVTVAGLEGNSTVIEAEVVDKKSGDVVSKIDIENVYSASDELLLMQKFDRKMARRTLRSAGGALRMDFDAMRGRMMDRPEMQKALEEMRKAGVGEDQAVVRTVTRISGIRPPAGDEEGAASVESAASAESAESAESAASAEEKPKKRGRLAERMMAKMKQRRERQREVKRTEAGAPDQSPPMSFSSELQSVRSGVKVSLPPACVEAYDKQTKK